MCVSTDDPGGNGGNGDPNDSGDDITVNANVQITDEAVGAAPDGFILLEAEAGNRRRAAERLQIGLRTLYDKIKKYDL